MPRRLAPWISVAVLAGVLACQPPVETPEETTPELRVVSVETAAAEAATVAVPVEATGTLRAWREVLVSAEGSGRVLTLGARLGDPVKKGDVLARLDSRVPEAQLAQAEAHLRGAEASLELSEASFAQAEHLLSQSATSSSAHLQARVGLEGARAQVDAAAAAVDLAETAVSNTTIRAPWSGVVAAVQLEVGALVGPGQPAFRLVDTGRLKVSVGIPGTEIARVMAGQPAHVELPSLGDDVLIQGELAHVGPEPDPVTRTWPAEVVIDNDGRLHAGQLARVAVVVGERDDAVVVPDNAVGGDDDPVVFVVENDIARARDVTLGQSLGDLIEIRRGVKAGEEVVTLGRQHLSDGSPIRRYRLGEGAESTSIVGSAEADTSDSTVLKVD